MFGTSTHGTSRVCNQTSARAKGKLIYGTVSETFGGIPPVVGRPDTSRFAPYPTKPFFCFARRYCVTLSSLSNNLWNDNGKIKNKQAKDTTSQLTTSGWQSKERQGETALKFRTSRTTTEMPARYALPDAHARVATHDKSKNRNKNRKEKKIHVLVRVS